MTHYHEKYLCTVAAPALVAIGARLVKVIVIVQGFQRNLLYKIESIMRKERERRKMLPVESIPRSSKRAHSQQ